MSIKKNNLIKKNHKLVSIDELVKIKSKANKSLIICHGVFDVVHPGHVRHLIYAKSKADILVVSLTADKHIDKGIYRPHVPEKIRAFNLAAFEVVDYVIIDKYPTPINNLKKIKPNFFAKGFEYNSKKINPKTQLEIETLKKFGGQIIFTPGDVVYSSTKLLTNHLPDIKYEKLSSLMKDHNITIEHLKRVLQNFKKLKVHVVGDTIVDTYTEGTFIGGQTKTPTISILYEKHTDYVGGAGIVAKHLKAAGANVIFTSVLGNDELSKYVIKDIKKDKIKFNTIIDNSRPTVNKNAIISSGYRLLKIDKIDNSSISQEILEKITKNIKNEKCNGLLLSDFRHGIFNKLTIEKILHSIPKKIFKAADSQVASRWGNIIEFPNFDLITPNEREARFALADQDSTVGTLSSILYEKTKYKNLIMKLGQKGVFCSSNSKNDNTYFSLDSFAETIVDPVGAGDALIAYSSLSLMMKEKLPVASILGSLAAAVECELDGNIPVKVNDVLKKLNSLKQYIDQ